MCCIDMLGQLRVPQMEMKCQQKSLSSMRDELRLVLCFTVTRRSTLAD